MAIDNSITFGGVNSADFGIYISGEGAFDAPKRDVEMVAIPGRNGEFALDKGRFENIEVTYPAFNREEDLDTFAEKLSDFRNAIASQVGYQRLTDTFHPDEYRMATFVDGLEIKPIKYNTAAQFDIVFNCKPQRYLTSGETAISVDSGDTVTNPTRFASSPLLEVEGYGAIHLQDETVTLENTAIGEVLLINSGTLPVNWSANYDVANYSLLDTGDDITLQAGTSLTVGYSPTGGYGSDKVTAMTMTVTSSDVACHITSPTTYGSGKIAQVILDEPIVCPKGSTVTKNITISASVTYQYRGASRTYSGTKTIACTMNTVRTSFTQSNSPTLPSDLNQSSPTGKSKIGTVMGNSTRLVTGGLPVFIDLDIGEAYIVTDEGIAPLNSYIDLGSELPTLGSGENEITYDNTIESLKITPRWWKI